MRFSLSFLSFLALSPFFVSVVFAGSRQLVIEGDGRSFPFNVEVVSTPADLGAGLMYRVHIGSNEGMLFDYFIEEHVVMWMKNTYVSLDMLFIGEDGVIRRIEEHTIPFSVRNINSGVPVRYVLELQGGTANRLGIVSGYKILFPSRSQ